MRYEIQRGICDLLRVELEAGEAVIAAVIAEVGKFIFARGAVEWDVTLPGRGFAGFKEESKPWSSRDDDLRRAGGRRFCRMDT